MNTLKIATLALAFIGTQALAELKLQFIEVAGDVKIAIPFEAKSIATENIDSVVKKFKDQDREINIDYGAFAGRLRFFDNVDKFSMKEQFIDGRQATDVDYFDKKARRFVSAISVADVRKAECEGTICSSSTKRDLLLHVICGTESCQRENKNFLTKIEINESIK